MQPTIKHEFPPNIETIRKHFPLTGNEVFAYDKVIYHPGAGLLTAPLIAHEMKHFEQQGEDPAGWWDRYIADTAFRFEMELEAHQVEFKTYCQLHPRSDLRWKYLHRLVFRMFMPTYSMIPQGMTRWELMHKIKGHRKL